MNIWVVVSFIAGIISVGVSFAYYQWVARQDPGDERAQRVAGWIEDGARSYLKKLYVALGGLSVALAIILAIVFGLQENLGYGLSIAVAFVFGAICSAVAGYMGMSIAVKANVRTAAAANKGLNPAFVVSFNAGSVMGLAMVGLALVGMSLIFLITFSSLTRCDRRSFSTWYSSMISIISSKCFCCVASATMVVRFLPRRAPVPAAFPTAGPGLHPP